MFVCPIFRSFNKISYIETDISFTRENIVSRSFTFIAADFSEIIPSGRKYPFAFVRENFGLLHERHIDFPGLPAHPRSLSSPGDTHFDALLDFSSAFRCTRTVSRRVASRIALPAAFPRAAILKVANHPLLPQFSSGLNRTSSSQVRRKVNMPELFRSRGNVVRLNEKTTNYGRVHRVHRAPPATPPPDSMSLPEFFSPDISVRCARHPLCLSAWHTRSVWHYVHTHTHAYIFVYSLIFLFVRSA